MSAPKIIVLVRLKLQSELYWAFSEIVRRFQAESAAAKGDLALAQRAGETAKFGQADGAGGKHIVRHGFWVSPASSADYRGTHHEWQLNVATHPIFLRKLLANASWTLHRLLPGCS